MRRFLIIVALLAVLPCAALARDQLRATGSTTVFPFVAAAAEQFGRAGAFRTPIVEATGTGGGFKAFCAGTGDATPDIADASRPIKPAETALCHAHGVTDITELKIGYDGIVLANARSAPHFALTRADIFLALAREVPRGGRLVANPYQRWREVNPALPDVPIIVFGSPSTSGTRDAFVELVMQVGCHAFPEFSAAYPDEEIRKHRCAQMREDGAFVEEGENGNLIIQKLLHNEAALGIFGYNFLEQNETHVQAATIERVAPTFGSITRGDYTLARGLYIYVKNDHVHRIPALKPFVQEILSDAATGEDGYLMMRGLLPLTAAEHAQMQRIAAAMR